VFGGGAQILLLKGKNIKYLLWIVF